MIASTKKTTPGSRRSLMHSRGTVNFQQTTRRLKGLQRSCSVSSYLMINHYLSVVENVGFCSLLEHLEPKYSLPSRKYISETAVSKLYNRVSSQLAVQLKDVKSMSFTADIWTSDVSITVHWVNTYTYALPSAVLQVKKCIHQQFDCSIHYRDAK